MSQGSSFKLNISQNKEDFKLPSLKDQPPLFKYKYLEKILNPPQENIKNTRTCTIKCLVRGCR